MLSVLLAVMNHAMMITPPHERFVLYFFLREQLAARPLSSPQVLRSLVRSPGGQIDGRYAASVRIKRLWAFVALSSRVGSEDLSGSCRNRGEWNVAAGSERQGRTTLTTV